MNTTAKTLEELVARAHAIRDAGSDVLDLAGFWPLIEVAAANLPAPDYTAMSGPELLHTCRDDGHKWATAFCQHAKKQGHNIDHGWMVGWFANAIEHSHDVRTGGGPVVLPDGSAFFVAEVKYAEWAAAVDRVFPTDGAPADPPKVRTPQTPENNNG